MYKTHMEIAINNNDPTKFDFAINKQYTIINPLSAMRAASQLPGKGPTDVDDAPAPAS